MTHTWSLFLSMFLACLVSIYIYTFDLFKMERFQNIGSTFLLLELELLEFLDSFLTRPQIVFTATEYPNTTFLWLPENMLNQPIQMSQKRRMHANEFFFSEKYRHKTQHEKMSKNSRVIALVDYPQAHHSFYNMIIISKRTLERS